MAFTSLLAHQPLGTMSKALELNCGIRFLCRKTYARTNQRCEDSFFYPIGDCGKIFHCSFHCSQIHTVRALHRRARALETCVLLLPGSGWTWFLYLPHLRLLVAVPAAPGPDACAAITQRCEVTYAPSMCALWAAHVTGAVRGRVARASKNDGANAQNCNDNNPTGHDILRLGECMLLHSYGGSA